MNSAGTKRLASHYPTAHNGQDGRPSQTDRYVGGDRYPGKHLFPLLAGGAVAAFAGLLDRPGHPSLGARAGLLGAGVRFRHSRFGRQFLRSFPGRPVPCPLVLRRSAGGGVERPDAGQAGHAHSGGHDPWPAHPRLAGRAAERASRRRCHARGSADSRLRGFPNWLCRFAWWGSFPRRSATVSSGWATWPRAPWSLWTRRRVWAAC